MTMHLLSMRRLFPLSLALFAAACAPRPQATPAPEAPVAPPVRPQSSLYGLSPQELVGHFGKPALQIREGSSIKLQFRGPRCVLDAFLYPARDGQLRVTYVDTRAPSGDNTDQAACILALETPS
jgi:hypothetical protein